MLYYNYTTEPPKTVLVIIKASIYYWRLGCTALGFKDSAFEVRALGSGALDSQGGGSLGPKLKLANLKFRADPQGFDTHDAVYHSNNI